MSDTTLQNCNCCEIEDDCIDGLCQCCAIYNQKLQKQSDLLTLGLLQEKNKYDALKASHTKLVEALGNMVKQFAKYTPQLNQDKCWEIIQAKQALKEAEKIK